MILALASGLRKPVTVALLGLMFLMASVIGYAQTTTQKTECHIGEVDYQGWHAEQLSNRWLQLVIVPQNGGRLIQVTFSGHPYLFVNPKLAGKYFPPSSDQWFNYGGDKLWLLPEGTNDEQHWVGNSDVIDDSPFTFRKVSEGTECEIELTGPKDPQTGIQFSRRISIDSDSPRIRFHASMTNVTGHPLEWSMQSVSQYDTSNHASTKDASASPMNRDFWTFTPANPASSYLNRYHVRFGPGENRAVEVRDDGLFTVHYVHQAAELWLDSTQGWLAVVDGSSRYAMVERFQYDTMRPYPGKASVIFWTNGPEARLKDDGEIAFSKDPDSSPYYLEAELNSPMCRLRPGDSCTFDTEWFPTRAGSEFHGVSDAGILIHPLKAVHVQNDAVKLSGVFGVFFSGHLEAWFYDEHGANLARTRIADVNPTEALSIEKEVPAAKAARVSLHLIDDSGVDHGSLQEIRIENGEIR
jgi:hypothetical protein